MPADSLTEAFLTEQQERYQAAPDQAGVLLAELLPRFMALPEPPPPDAPVIAWALMVCQLAFEERQPLLAVPAFERAMHWADAGREPALLARLCCAGARLRASQQLTEDAAALLARASALMEHKRSDPVAPATLAHTLGMLAMLQGDAERALAQYQRALELFKQGDYRGPWVQVYARMAIALRQLGRHAERREMLLEGRRQARAQHRFGEAANLSAGLVDMLLEAGDSAEAAACLEEGEALLVQGQVPMGAASRLALLGARARWLAASGRPTEACACLEPQLEAVACRGGPSELLRTLDEMSTWRRQAGDGAAALALSRRAHQLRLQMERQASGRRALHARQQLELAQAEREQRQNGQRAAEAEAQQQRLQQALDRLQALQQELADRSRQASLGPLLAGVAHELNTPLGSALTALSSATELGRTLLAELGSGTALGRQALLARLQGLSDLQALAERSLQRALALTESYRPANPDGDARSALAELVDRAWRRALAPDHRLELHVEDRVGAAVWPGTVIEEVLVQLFQNVERHAYAGGSGGPVSVCGQQPAPEALRLVVEDRGRGIAPDLLPRVFEPYVSTQFGRGRSGLGLFVAERAVRQRLGGRLRVRSQPGQGSSFEIECPLPPED